LNLPYVEPLETVYSAADDYVFCSVFNDPPEFAFFIRNNDTYKDTAEDLLMTSSQVKPLFDADTSSYRTLLNPNNIREFFEAYQLSDWANIYRRFGLSSQTQVHALYDYLFYNINYLLQSEQNY
jgi:hypothetical protein